MHYLAARLFTALLVGATVFALVAQGPTPSGIFSNDAAMVVERDGASAAVLLDGRVLVTGGKDANGNTLASAEILGQGAVGPMSYARSGHASVTLQDGRVLITGGIAGSNAAEIFNPATGQFETPTLAVGQPRVGGTATLLNDGRVLLAGGDGSTMMEIFNPATGQVTNAANMSVPRKNHAATVLRDGRVVLVGGSDANGPLASVDIYDPETNTVSAGPSLLAPRAGLSAITLMDQRVFVSGGGTNTTEILDLKAGTAAAGPNAGSAHSVALLLPNNNTVLMMGGPDAAAEIYVPWTNSFQPFGTLAAARGGAPAAAAVSKDFLVAGQARIAGGAVASGESTVVTAAVERVQFPVIIPDKWDYQPGDTVHLYGAGFTPGAWVSLTWEEDPLPTDHHEPLPPVQADVNGSFSEDVYLVTDHDLGVRFYVTATDAAGLTAGTTFTDARNWNLNFAGTGSGSVTITVSAGTVNAPQNCGGTGTDLTSQTVTSTCSPNITTSANGATIMFSAAPSPGSTFGGWSGVTNTSSSTCSGETNPCSLVFGGNGSITVTFNLAGDTTPPAVVSINRSDADPTKATTLHWEVTFSESVTGVDTGDFALATSGTTGGTISSVSGGGSTYTVAVTGVSGTGTLGLNLNDNDSIVDGAGNKLGGTGTGAVGSGGAGNGSFAGQTYTVDNTPPVSTISFPTATIYNAAAWDAGCSTPGGDICGTSTDSGGSTLASVKVSIKRESTGQWWDGYGFDSSTEVFFPATLGTAPNWSYAFPSTNFPADGNYTVHAKGTDALGNEETSPTVTFTIDITPPAVVSITRQTPAGEFTNAASVEYLVTFSEAVTGVDTGDFVLTTTGGISGASITSVSADTGTTRTVTVNTGTGDGTIRLDLDDNNSIVDAASNPLGGAGEQDFTSGQSYTIDKTKPVSLITFPVNDASYNTAGWNAGCTPVGICGTSTEANTLTSVKVSIKRNGSTNKWWDGSGFNSTSEEFFEATVSGSAPNWSWNLAFAASNFPADDSYTVHAYGTDNAGNIETSPFATFTIDNTPPTVTVEQKAGQADPTNALPIEFTATFSEAVTGFAAEDVTVGWTGAGAPSVNILGTGPVYTIQVTGVTSSGTVTVSIGAATVKDLAGNDNTASTSTDNSVLYDIDKPTSVITFPANGSIHNTTTFTAGCTAVAIDTCGTAADTGGSGLKEVRVSILGPNGNYWDGVGFNNTSETYLIASGTASWSMVFGLGGTGSYTIHARAEDNAGNLQNPVAGASFIINALPVVTNDGPKAATQYSDPINPVTITAADSDGLPAGDGLSVFSTEWKLNGGSYTSGLPGSLSLTPVSAGTEYARQWTLSGLWTLAPGKYFVKVCISDGLDVGCTEVEINITKEDADVTYTGPNYVVTASATTTTITVPLTATIRDITALGGLDTDAGDIRNARVKFRKDGVDIAGCTNLQPVLVNPADLKTGTVGCTANFTVSNTPYTIDIIVYDYYCGTSGDASQSLLVQTPTETNKITGGGTIINGTSPNPVSAGVYAGLPGAKTNYGFVVQYNKSGKNLQGNMNIIIRAPGGKVYQIKANAMQSLQVQPATCGANACGKATFISKANVKDITDPDNPISSPYGNAMLTMSLDDKGEPGKSDQISIQLYDGNTLLYSSAWNGAATVLQTINSGNLVVH